LTTLTEVADVSFTTVSRWENGHGKPSRLARRQLQELLDRVRARKAAAKRKGTA
jgi:DNA-binding transcriptional regulator YiaG